MSTPSHHAVRDLLTRLDPELRGEEMMALARRLYPIPRSITGDGVRETLGILRETVPLTVHEVPTGTRVFDWTVPKEWNVTGARLTGPGGETIVDVADHTLHLLGYSVPVRKTLPLAELREHLFTLPETPDLTPYRTSYYSEAWGFCLPHRVAENLPEGDYRVEIDTSLEDGSLTYGELAIPGESEREVLFSCHVCHPSLANDNLSGIAVLHALAALLGSLPERSLRYTYRFLFIPGTIGSITWLAGNRERAGKVAHGLVAANLGDDGSFHYKRSRRGDAEIDRAVAQVLADSGDSFEIEDFVPFGYDERQFCSPGFDLAVGSLTRTPWGRYPEYHTSADDLSLISGDSLAESLGRYLQVVELLEGNRTYLNRQPYGEPQLGKRGLYASIGGGGDGRRRQLALLWVLNLSDGRHSLLDVARRAAYPFHEIRQAADLLLEADLLEEVHA
jgi:aminopeptidase-like protein